MGGDLRLRFYFVGFACGSGEGIADVADMAEIFVDVYDRPARLWRRTKHTCLSIHVPISVMNISHELHE